MAVIIAGSRKREIGIIAERGVVVNHIHHHADACLMQSLHHFLHLADAAIWIGRICGIRAFGYVVVQRVIAPIVLTVDKLRLVDCVVVIRRKDVHMGHSKLLQVGDSCQLSVARLRAWLKHCHKLAFVDDARIAVDGEITMVHLVDNCVGLMRCDYIGVASPSFRVCLREIDNSGSMSVDAHGFSPHSWRFLQPFAAYLYLERIKFTI